MVTQHRVYSLGEIVAADIPVMRLSDFGKNVDTEWQKSFEIRNELFLDEYIIMPNHLHAIVIINNNESMTVDEPVADKRRTAVRLYVGPIQYYNPNHFIVYPNPYHRFWRDLNRR